MGLKKVEPEPDYKDLLDRFMLHISCYDPELKKYLDQWLAYLYQKGLTPKTALLMRGVQGTGKGTLFNLLKNLFDSKYVMQLTCDIVNEKYNSFLMRNRICVINEIPSDDKELTVFSNKVKTWITDDSQAIREIYKPVVVAEINTAFIANSNFARSLILEGSDRRWTIFSYNQEPISSHFSGPELDLLNSKDISEEFAKYLSCVEIKKHPTEKGILVPERYFKTDAKTNLTEDSETIAQRIVSALSKKDLGYFDENLEDYKLMNQLNICFKKNLIPTFVIINILEKAGKHTNSFTVHNILKRTQFSDFFKKKAFRLGGMETGSHSFKGFEFKDDVPYKLDYSNHEVKTQESTRI